MKVTRIKTQTWIKTLSKVAAVVCEKLVGVYAGAKPKERRRLPLLSALLLFMTMVTLSGSLALRSTNLTSSYVMLATSGLLFSSYFVSRTKYYLIAIRLAIFFSVIPLVANVFIRPQEITASADFMWLALPLLVASLILTIRQTVIVALTYITLTIILASLGSFGHELIVLLVLFILSISVFVIAIANVRDKDQAETETQLKERRQAEEALRESEERFRQIFEQGPIGIILSGMDHKIQFVNEKYCNMLGYTEKELRSLNYKNYSLPEEIKADEEQLEKLAKGKMPFYHREKRVFRKNKEIVWESVTVTLLRGKTGKPLGFLAMVEDITERKKAEEELAREATRRRILVEQSRDGIVVLDRDGNVYEANQRFAEMLGYTPKEARKLKVYDWEFLYPPEQVLEMIRTVDEKGDHFETQHKRKDGTTYDVEISTNGAMIAGQKLIFCVCRDITERKQMEKSIKESEEKFSKAFMSSPQAIVVTSLDEGVIIEANETFAKLSGYSRKELVGKKAIDLHLWNSQEERENVIKTLDEKGVVKNLERQFIDKDGKVNTWLFSADKINIDNKPCMISATMDITEQKKAEEQLRYSDIILKSINEGIFAMDNDFVVNQWNKSCEQILGVKAAEAIGKPVTKVINIVEEYPGQTQDRINDLGKNGRWKGEQTYLTPQGNKWANVHAQSMEENGKRTGWVTLVSDITERKRAEEALKQSEEKFRELINTSTDAIISTDTEMIIKVWNNGATRMFGYTEKEMLGQSILTIFPTDLYKDISREINNIKNTGKDEFSNKVFETSGLKKDCSTVPIEISLSSRKAEDNYIITAIIRDITTRKEAERKLHEIDKMKQEFLSNVSHELRTPLQSISGFTKLIMNGKVPDPATQQEFFQIIDTETTHLGNLINSLLDMSRLESGRFKIYKKVTPVYDIFTDSIKMFHSLAKEKDITLTESISSRLPMMDVDSERMRQVVINLLSNAVKFSDPGSSVHVKAGVRNNKLLFQVIDHGPGIEKEDLKHLFERFYRVEGEKVKGGTGLGLYISKQIIDAHGGKIWAESKFGEGSTFNFTLPLNSAGGTQNDKENTSNRRRSGYAKTSRLLS